MVSISGVFEGFWVQEKLWQTNDQLDHSIKVLLGPDLFETFSHASALKISDLTKRLRLRKVFGACRV
jgi:hypothetical protein